MFGVLPCNAFLNMKMANPDDKRSFRDFKTSLCRWSQLHSPALWLRWRKRSKIDQKLIQQAVVQRQAINPFRCRIKDGKHPKQKLAAARYCSRSGPHRFIRISDLFPGETVRIQCKWQDDLQDPSTRCKELAKVGFLACGTEFCLSKVSNFKNKTPLSHASAAHQPHWFHQDGPKAFYIIK